MSVRLLTFSFSFSLVVNKQAGFHLIDKSARLSPSILIQLQFGLNGLRQGSKSQRCNQFYSKHSVMPFTLSYLQTTGASKTERELLIQTNAFYKQRFSNKTVLHVASSTFFYVTFLIYPSLIDSVVCLSQTTTKFVLLTILNHRKFISERNKWFYA